MKHNIHIFPSILFLLARICAFYSSTFAYREKTYILSVAHSCLLIPTGFSVDFSLDGTFVKGHDILRQSPRFIRENVLDLAQLLIESRVTSFGGSVRFWVVHFDVPSDEKAQGQTNDFHAEIMELSELGKSVRDAHKMVSTKGSFVSANDVPFLLHFF